MLEVKDLNAFYGKSHILRGVNFHISKGEIVALLGRNGVGRSTTCKAIMGEVAPIGSIKFKEEEIAGKKAFEIAKLGLGYVPENRDVFPGLTTKQNLQLGIKPGQDVDNSRWSLETPLGHLKGPKLDVHRFVFSFWMHRGRPCDPF